MDNDVQITLGILSRKFRFVQIPKAIITYQCELGINNDMLAFLNHCYWYGDNCFASYKTMAKKMGKSVDSIRRYADKLVEKQLLHRVYRIINEETNEIKEIGENFNSVVPEGWRYTSCCFDLALLELKAFNLAVEHGEFTIDEAKIEMTQRQQKNLQGGGSKSATTPPRKSATTVPANLQQELDSINDINDEVDINLSSINASQPELTFINLYNNYKLVLNDKKTDKRQLAGILVEMMKLLEFKKPTFPLAQKYRKDLGDEKLLEVLWNMYGKHINNKFDGKISTPEKYISGAIANYKKSNTEKQSTIDKELIDKYKLINKKFSTSKREEAEVEFKDAIELDSKRLNTTVAELRKRIESLLLKERDKG